MTVDAVVIDGKLVEEKIVDVIEVEIDGVTHRWEKETITVLEIAIRGGWPASEDAVIIHPELGERRLEIHEVVKIELGIRFVRPKPCEITVNTRTRAFSGREISFIEVVRLAFDTSGDNANTTYTVTFQDGDPSKPQGSMVPGGCVKVRCGMVFDVAASCLPSSRSRTSSPLGRACKPWRRWLPNRKRASEAPKGGASRWCSPSSRQGVGRGTRPRRPALSRDASGHERRTSSRSAGRRGGNCCACARSRFER